MAMHINDKAKHNKNSKMKSNFNSEDEVKDSFGEALAWLDQNKGSIVGVL